MGHFTVLGDSVNQALVEALAIKAELVAQDDAELWRALRRCCAVWLDQRPARERRSPPQSKSLRRSRSGSVSWKPKALGLL